MALCNGGLDRKLVSRYPKVKFGRTRIKQGSKIAAADLGSGERKKWQENIEKRLKAVERATDPHLQHFGEV